MSSFPCLACRTLFTVLPPWTLTAEQLHPLTQNVQSDRVERKRSASDRSALRCGICASANELAGPAQPGYPWIGLDDDGNACGLSVTDELLRMLAPTHDDGNILPLPSLEVRTHTLDGKAVVVVTVYPSQSPPVRYQGRVWIRVGPMVRLATLEEERRGRTHPGRQSPV